VASVRRDKRPSDDQVTPAYRGFIHRSFARRASSADLQCAFMSIDGAVEPVDQIDYPALLTAAEAASNRGQRWYVRLVQTDVGLIVLGALAGALSSIGPVSWQQGAAVLTAVILATAVVMRWVNRTQKPNRTWFDGRAVAESIKTRSWRYMMRVDPFAGSDAEADGQFVTELRDMLLARRDLSISGVQPGASQITETMRRIRRQPFEARRQTYVNKRLRDQIDWYSSRATHHQRRSGVYFGMGLLAELSAIAWAMYRITAPISLNLIGVFASLAVAATALSHLHSEDELAHSYAVAAQELSAISALTDSTTEDTFPQLVKDAEGAISREHTMWVAKRS
jgi:conflict system pore-forming effector with SLATT domain